MEGVKKEVSELRKEVERLRRSAETGIERCERAIREHREEWKEGKKKLEKWMEFMIEAVRGRKWTGPREKND